MQQNATYLGTCLKSLYKAKQTNKQTKKHIRSLFIDFCCEINLQMHWPINSVSDRIFVF